MATDSVIQLSLELGTSWEDRIFLLLSRIQNDSQVITWQQSSLIQVAQMGCIQNRQGRKVLFVYIFGGNKDNSWGSIGDNF